jgi:hypothetical protein
MIKVPQCWRACKNENYRVEIDRERKILLKKIDQGIEEFQNIKRLIYSGNIEEVYLSFSKCQSNLGNCLGGFKSVLSINCQDCQHRDFDLGEL